jgi:hypothetical protein
MATATDFSGDYLAGASDSQPGAWIDPITGTLGKLTDIYVELQSQKLAGQAAVSAQQTAAQAAAAQQTAAKTQAATVASQWVPGVSNTTLVVGGVAIVGLVILLGILRSK